MTQLCYIGQWLKLFGLNDSQPAATSMVEQSRLLVDMKEQNINPTLYWKHEGKLKYNSHTLNTISILE